MNENRNKLGRRIAPGLWEDLDGFQHISIPELLKLFDLPDTPEQRKIVGEMIKKQLLEKNPDMLIVEQGKPD